ncbi:MAG TPA: MEDS domain-containing protein [Phycisphaerae bacterium]|nr:MEDS domain-containing protein [Phycisphaerae bacterium]
MTMKAKASRLASAFWGELSPSEHMVQIYDADATFLDSLEGFVCGGLCGGEGVIVIATAAHRTALADRLELRCIDVNAAADRDQYLTLDADEALAKFMLDEWPDELRFQEMMGDLLGRAGRGGRRVRAFGEMVARLWANGQCGATVRLEHLWQDLCQRRGFSLFCAYPRVGFTQSADAGMREVLAAHSRYIA